MSVFFTEHVVGSQSQYLLSGIVQRLYSPTYKVVIKSVPPSHTSIPPSSSLCWHGWVIGLGCVGTVGSRLLVFYQSSQ